MTPKWQIEETQTQVHKKCLCISSSQLGSQMLGCEGNGRQDEYERVQTVPEYICFLFFQSYLKVDCVGGRVRESVVESDKGGKVQRGEYEAEVGLLWLCPELGFELINGVQD